MKEKEDGEHDKSMEPVVDRRGASFASAHISAPYPRSRPGRMYWRRASVAATCSGTVNEYACMFWGCRFCRSWSDNLSGNDASRRVCGVQVGFLGAGAIMKDGGNARGLNTAATLWCSAAVGACAGAGEMLDALFVTAA